MPLINVSYDKGVTWSSQLDRSALPSDFQAGCFFSGSHSSMRNNLLNKKQFGAKAILGKIFEIKLKSNRVGNIY